MKVIRISKANAFFQIVHALKTNREKRNHEGFLVEGVRNINNALAHKWPIKAFFYSSEKGLSGWARGVLDVARGAMEYDLSLPLLVALSEKEETSELIALLDIPPDDQGKIPVHKDLLVAVFDRPGSPGNLGTLIRSLDAFGADGLIVTGHGADVYDPETVRATTGSLFALPVLRMSSQKEMAGWIDSVRERLPDLQVIGTDERGEMTLYECDLRRPTIILVGNEKFGLSAHYRELADVMAKIPIVGSASSLNVAVASSIVLAEARRQRVSP